MGGRKKCLIRMTTHFDVPGPHDQFVFQYIRTKRRIRKTVVGADTDDYTTPSLSFLYDSSNLITAVNTWTGGLICVPTFGAWGIPASCKTLEESAVCSGLRIMIMFGIDVGEGKVNVVFNINQAGCGLG